MVRFIINNLTDKIQAGEAKISKEVLPKIGSFETEQTLMDCQTNFGKGQDTPISTQKMVSQNIQHKNYNHQ